MLQHVIDDTPNTPPPEPSEPEDERITLAREADRLMEEDSAG